MFLSFLNVQNLKTLNWYLPQAKETIQKYLESGRSDATNFAEELGPIVLPEKKIATGTLYKHFAATQQTDIDIFVLTMT